MMNMAQQVQIRRADPTDVPALAALMNSYMRETYDDGWHGSPEAMALDGFGSEFEMHVASKGNDLIGFAAWKKAYDLHHWARVERRCSTCS